MAELRGVAGLIALTLGGSWASGRQRPDSDIDLGLYYGPEEPLDVAAIKEIAARLNDTPDPVVTELGGWGPWVNGGAWLTIAGHRTDFLYRDLGLVADTIDECLAGRSKPDYWQQPPYGFHSQIYCAEIKWCRPLYERRPVIAPLKAKVTAYPQALKRRVVDGFLWSAWFTLEHARKFAERGEPYLVAGCLTRAVAELVQVLYGLNETFFFSDKHVYRDVAGFAIAPADFMARVDALMGGGVSESELTRRIELADTLRREVLALAGDLYTARY
jgi:hypothetical protein